MNGPRITPMDVENAIASEHYFVASDALQHANSVHKTHAEVDGWYLGATQRLTICVLQLKNGFTVTGESACVSPENFDAEIGRRVARENAIDKLWPLLGYELQCRLVAAAPTKEPA